MNWTLKVRQDVVRKKLRARRDSRTTGGKPQGWKEPGGRGRMAREDWKGQPGSFWEGTKSQIGELDASVWPCQWGITGSF